MSDEQLKTLRELANWLSLHTQNGWSETVSPTQLRKWSYALAEASIALSQARLEIAASRLAVTHPHGEIGIGDEVEKTFGHRWPGIVRSVFTTESGKVRYVVEITEPALHGALFIFKGDEIRKHKPGPEPVLTVSMAPMPRLWAKEAERDRLTALAKTIDPPKPASAPAAPPAPQGQMADCTRRTIIAMRAAGMAPYEIARETDTALDAVREVLTAHRKGAKA